MGLRRRGAGLRGIEREVDWDRFEREAAAGMAALGLDEQEALAEAGRLSERTRARIAWAGRRLREFFELQEKAGEAWLRLIDSHPEVEDWESPDAPQLREPPEETEAQAVYREVMAAIREDRWPRHLHFAAV